MTRQQWPTFGVHRCLSLSRRTEQAEHVRHDETKPSWHGNSRNGNSSFDHSEHVPLSIGGSSKDWRIMACYPRV